MIVIKIKTWEDYKEQFLDWVREPRKRRCKEYVDYVNAVSSSYIENLLIPNARNCNSKNVTQRLLHKPQKNVFKVQ